MRRLGLFVVVLATACRSGVERDDAMPSALAQATSFDAVIAPIFSERCSACHGEKKQKGGLRLSDRTSISLGGESGPLFDAAAPQTSEMLRRLRLPLGDDEHMPPKGEPQLRSDELLALAAWVQAGAPFEGQVAGVVAPDARVEAVAVSGPDLGPSAPPDARALDLLRSELVHAQLVSADATLVWIDFAAIAPAVDDALVARLLAPLREHIAELSLSRAPIGAPTLALAAGLPHLRRLDLRATKIGDAALAKLAHHARLEELVLAQTALSDASLATLLALPALKRVWVWHSGLSDVALAKLRETRPQLRVDAGDKPDAAVAEVEPKVVLTSEAPQAGALPPGSPDAPINTTCPVTGDPVNPKFTVKFEGRVVGFCCPNCPKTFEADPQLYAAKLPKN